MNILGLIPSRRGSKGIPHKNVAMCAGRPLIEWTLDAAEHVPFAGLIVSTDDPAVMDICDRRGVQGQWRLDAADDMATTADVVRYVLDTSQGMFSDAVCVLPPTTPLRTTGEIMECLQLMAANGCDSVFTISETESPARMCYREFDRARWYYPEQRWKPRQKLERAYVRAGSVYLATVDVWKRGTPEGNDCLTVVVPKMPNIDTPTDLELAEALLYARSRTRTHRTNSTTAPAQAGCDVH